LTFVVAAAMAAAGNIVLAAVLVIVARSIPERSQGYEPLHDEAATTHRR
jgi:hypothetical protein